MKVLMLLSFFSMDASANANEVVNFIFHSLTTSASYPRTSTSEHLARKNKDSVVKIVPSEESLDNCKKLKSLDLLHKFNQFSDDKCQSLMELVDVTGKKEQATHAYIEVPYKCTDSKVRVTFYDCT